MKMLHYTDVIGPVTRQLSGDGVFLNVAGETPNTMTIGWGSIGYYWGKPIFTVVVRPQRHTFGLLRAAGEFTVSIPTNNPLKKELTYAGVKSGRDENKFIGHGLTAAPAQNVAAPIVAECGLHMECKVLLTQNMTEDRMDAKILSTMYANRDLHTMFFGEILACYATDD